MSNQQLFVHLPNGIRGPFTWQQMQQGAMKGQVTPQHYVSYDGRSAFPAAQIWSSLVPAAPPQAMPTASAASSNIAPHPGDVADVGPVINVRRKLSPSEKIAKEKEDEAKGEEETDSVGLFMGGVVMIPLSIVAFFWLDSLEQEGGSAEVPWWFASIYNTLGKYGVVGILGGLGVLAAIAGWYQLWGSKKKR